MNTPRSSNLPQMEHLLISSAEAARLLSVCPRTLGELTASGVVPSIKLGRRRLYSPEALRAWVEARLRGAGAPTAGGLVAQRLRAATAGAATTGGTGITP